MQTVQRFCKEVVTWKTLRHPNVLSLLGFTMGNGQFAMVSEWMINGNINEFVKARKDVNRFELVWPFSYRRPPLLLIFPLIAQRCRKGIDVYARPGDDTWRR
jgi:serine/threonine protein kinase